MFAHTSLQFISKLTTLGSERLKKIKRNTKDCNFFFFLEKCISLTAASFSKTQTTLTQIPRLKAKIAACVKMYQRKKKKNADCTCNGAHQLSNVHTVQDASAEKCFANASTGPQCPPPASLPMTPQQLCLSSASLQNHNR